MIDGDDDDDNDDDDDDDHDDDDMDLLMGYFEWSQCDILIWCFMGYQS